MPTISRDRRGSLEDGDWLKGSCENEGEGKICSIKVGQNGVEGSGRLGGGVRLGGGSEIQQGGVGSMLVIEPYTKKLPVL